jgi:hypothetical protein
MPLYYRLMCSIYALRSLEEQRMRVGRVLELNDPFDCSLSVLEAGEHEGSVCHDVTKGVAQMRHETFGLLCFSRSIQNPVLWSHYADCHKGMALVFSFHKNRPDLYPVDYQKKRITIRLADIKNPAAHDSVGKAWMRTLLTKSTTWRYEKESRMLLELDKLQRSSGHYFLPFDGTTFAGVMLGLRCDVPHSYLRRTLDGLGWKKARIWRAKESAAEFRISREVLS